MRNFRPKSNICVERLYQEKLVLSLNQDKMVGVEQQAVIGKKTCPNLTGVKLLEPELILKKELKTMLA